MRYNGSAPGCPLGSSCHPRSLVSKRRVGIAVLFWIPLATHLGFTMLCAGKSWDMSLHLQDFHSFRTFLWFLACDKPCMNAKDAFMGSLTSLLGYQVDQAGSDWWMVDGDGAAHMPNTLSANIPPYPPLLSLKHQGWKPCQRMTSYSSLDSLKSSPYILINLFKRVFSVRWLRFQVQTVHACPASWSAVGSLQSVDLFLWSLRCKSAKPQKTKKEFGVLISKLKNCISFRCYKIQNKSKNKKEIIMEAWILKSLQYTNTNSKWIRGKPANLSVLDAKTT